MREKFSIPQIIAHIYILSLYAQQMFYIYYRPETRSEGATMQNAPCIQMQDADLIVTGIIESSTDILPITQTG